MMNTPLKYQIINAILIFTLITPSILAREREYNVGYMVIDLRYDENGLQKNLTVAIWYPTIATPKPFQYGGPTWGNVALNAKPVEDAGKFPFLAFSHGFGGTGLGSQFFTEELASHGWIVACPDHHDSHSLGRIPSGRVEKPDVRGTIEDAKEITRSTPEERDKYLYRPRELETVIRIMTTSAPFNRLIDTASMAVGGHSFGGFTSLALCGTMPEFYDERIRAVLMFSTGAAAYLFTEKELASVKIPSMLYLGCRERNQKRGEITMKELSETIYSNMPVPKYFLEVRGASHFSFNIRLSDGIGTRALSGTPRQFEVINKYSIAFLEKYVAGKTGQDEILIRKDRMITRSF
ncbi:MAG: hypothetical protein V1903_14160 [Bacteroidota bacterium]